MTRSKHLLPYHSEWYYDERILLAKMQRMRAHPPDTVVTPEEIAALRRYIDHLTSQASGYFTSSVDDPAQAWGSRRLQRQMSVLFDQWRYKEDQ